eukprot:COSAG05_NODE_630_length_8210_cov_5.004563_2_plen_164_part_00
MRDAQQPIAVLACGRGYCAAGSQPLTRAHQRLDGEHRGASSPCSRGLQRVQHEQQQLREILGPQWRDRLLAQVLQLLKSLQRQRRRRRRLVSLIRAVVHATKGDGEDEDEEEDEDEGVHAAQRVRPRPTTAGTPANGVRRWLPDLPVQPAAGEGAAQPPAKSL